MAILGDLLVQGRSRFLQKIYAASLDIGEDTTIAGTLTLSKTNDAVGTSNNSPALVVGGTATTAHLELDSNEIMAKTNGTTAADIYINADGGVIYLSKSGIETQVRGNLRVQGTSTFTGASTHSGNLTVSGTTSLAGTSVSSDLNVANNAKVNGILTVEEEIRSPKWIIDNIANLGGEFIIAPTIICENNTSVNISGPSNNLYTITVTDGSITSDTFGGIAWSTGSVVKVSGTINDTVLVSINGTMTRALNQTTGTIQFTVSSSNITLTAGTYTGTKVKNLHIMMYKVGNVAPVGIFMTSYGQSHYPYIDIYSGTTSGSFYSPTTRLGYLNGLTDENGNALKINNISPTGWGLYTSNGYFSGTIVSTSGKIGGFTLNTNAIYNGTTSLASTNAGVYLGTNGIRNYKNNTHYVNIQEGVITALGANITGVITATSGEIGGFAIDSSSIHTKNVAVTSNADNSISLSSTDFTRTINSTSRAGLRFAIGDKFGITGDGTLYTNGANITNINANNISTGTINTNRLDAATIKSTIVQTTELNADKITSGTIDAARIAAGSIAVGKIDATSGTFNTANIPTLTADKIDATNLHVSAANIDGSLTIGNIDGLQTALNGKQPTGSYATTNQLATKSDKTLPDTRNDNQPPSWYISTYPRQSITEFKYANKIGFTSAASNVYCTLTTIVPWNDASGGYPTQSTIVSGVKYYRVGTGASTWSDWSAEETAAGAQAKADSKDEAIAAAAKRTNVAVTVTAIDYDLGTATLQATLYIDGTATTSNVTYKWLKDGSIISGQTARTLSITAAMGLSHVYSCTVTYS